MTWPSQPRYRRTSGCDWGRDGENLKESKRKGLPVTPFPRPSLSQNPSLLLPCCISRLAQVSAQVGRPEGFDHRVGAARRRQASPLPPNPPCPHHQHLTVSENLLSGYGTSTTLGRDASNHSQVPPLNSPKSLPDRKQKPSALA